MAGRTSWTAMLEAVPRGPLDDLAEVTAAQVRQVVDRLREAGQWAPADPPILVVFNAGYDLIRLAWLLWDVPVIVLGRLRSDRVFHLPCPPQVPRQTGRPRRHGPVIDLDVPDKPPGRDSVHVADTSGYSTSPSCRYHVRSRWGSKWGARRSAQGR